MKSSFNTLIKTYVELKSGIATSEKIVVGYLSENFVLNSGDKKYFLKCYRFKDKQRVIDAHVSKFFFASKGIPVILPIKNIEGDTITQIEDTYVSLFPFVSGLQFVPPDAAIPIQAPRNLGAMLGRIHAASESGSPEINQKFTQWNKEEFCASTDSILEVISNKKELTDFDRNAKEAIEFKKEQVKKENLLFKDIKGLRTGLIHGDYHDGNVFFDKGGSVINVFDFEKICIAPYSFEVIRSLQYSYCVGYNRQGSEERVEAFLSGYRTERLISSSELSQGVELFYQREIHGLWVEKEHYLKDNFRVDDLLHSKEYLLDLLLLRKKSMI